MNGTYSFHGPSALPYVGRLRTEQSLGLDGSIVYDVPQDINVIDTLIGTGRQFFVSCGTLPGGPEVSVSNDSDFGFSLDWGNNSPNQVSGIRADFSIVGELYLALGKGIVG